MGVSRTPPLTIATPEEVAAVRFDGEMEERTQEILTRYPNDRAALLPLLWLCQERWGWISTGIMEAVADRLGLSPAEVESVTSFYTMFRRRPPGRFHLQVCTTLSCGLCGAEAVAEALKNALGIDFGETTADGNFSLSDVQCLGACGEGPVIQVNDNFQTHVSVGEIDGLLTALGED